MKLQNYLDTITGRNYTRLFIPFESDGRCLFTMELALKYPNIQAYRIGIFKNDDDYVCHYCGDIDFAEYIKAIGNFLELNRDYDDVVLNNIDKHSFVHQYELKQNEIDMLLSFIEHGDEINHIQIKDDSVITYDIATYGYNAYHKKGNFIPSRYIHIWNMVDFCIRILNLDKRHPLVMMHPAKKEFDLFDIIDGTFDDYSYDNDFGLKIQCDFNENFSLVLYKNVVYFLEDGCRIEFLGNMKKYSDKYAIITCYYDEYIEGLVEEAIRMLERIVKYHGIPYAVILGDYDDEEELESFGYEEFDGLDEERILEVLGAYIDCDCYFCKRMI